MHFIWFATCCFILLWVHTNYINCLWIAPGLPSTCQRRSVRSPSPQVFCKSTVSQTAGKRRHVGKRPYTYLYTVFTNMYTYIYIHIYTYLYTVYIYIYRQREIEFYVYIYICINNILPIAYCPLITNLNFLRSQSANCVTRPKGRHRRAASQ